jgi:hypothetical protein
LGHNAKVNTRIVAFFLHRIFELEFFNKSFYGLGDALFSIVNALNVLFAAAIGCVYCASSCKNSAPTKRSRSYVVGVVNCWANMPFKIDVKPIGGFFVDKLNFLVGA